MNQVLNVVAQNSQILMWGHHLSENKLLRIQYEWPLMFCCSSNSFHSSKHFITLVQV